MGILKWLFGKPKPKRRQVRAQGEFEGPGTYEFTVVGTARYQDALEAICGGHREDGHNFKTTASLVLEDDNAHDNQAVRIDIKGKTVGYLSREYARQYRRMLNRTRHPRITASCGAMIVGGWDQGGGDRGLFGVRLDLPTKEG